MIKPKTEIEGKILRKFVLEQTKDGILFINGIPLFFDIENIAMQLQSEVWLETPTLKDSSSKAYII